MPYTPPNEISSIATKDRKRLEKLLAERAFMNAVLSLEALKKTGLTTEKIARCVIAWNDTEARKVRDRYNTEVSGILMENGISSVRHVDGFGNPKDYMWQAGSTSSLNKELLRKILLERGMDPTTVAGIIEAATKKTEYYTLRVAAVREQEEEDVQEATPTPKTRKATAGTRRR